MIFKKYIHVCAVYINGLIKNIMVIEYIQIYIIDKMFQCFKLPSCLLKHLVASFRLENPLNMNADSLELLNLHGLAPIIHKWQKAKSLVAS